MERPATGMLLIAEPFMKDPNFNRSVVLMCEHREEGSFGLVLNRGFHHKLSDLLPDMEGFDQPVFVGGPVQNDTLHFVHQYPGLIPGGSEVCDGVFWGGDFELAIRLLREGRIDASRIRFFIGYSGWSEGQLDQEMRIGSWLVTRANRNIVFHRNPDDVWNASLRNMGGEYEMLVNFPADPTLN